MWEKTGAKKNARGLDRVRGQNSLQRLHFKTDSKSESKFAIIYTNLEFLKNKFFPPDWLIGSSNSPSFAVKGQYYNAHCEDLG